MTNPQTLLSRNPEIFFAQMGDELIMMSEDQGKYLSLNAVASDIWQLLETPKAFADLCSALQEKYEVTPERCQSDLTQFVAQMLANNLLTQKL